MALKKQEHKASPYAVIDFETGGTDPKKDAISEIAINCFEGDSLAHVGKFECLIKPYGKNYDPKATAITGLTEDILEEKGITFEEACEKTTEFLIKCNVHESKTGYKPIIVAHNSIFETKFLQAMEKEGGVPLEKLLHGQVDYYGNFIPSSIDTMHLAKFLWAANVRQTKFTLEATLERAGIPLVDGHRAMNDVMPSSDFLQWIIKMLRAADSGNVLGGSTAADSLSFRKGFHFEF
jgi:DNA polymerase III epsilon subunit-like protein